MWSTANCGHISDGSGLKYTAEDRLSHIYQTVSLNKDFVNNLFGDVVYDSTTKSIIQGDVQDIFIDTTNSNARKLQDLYVGATSCALYGRHSLNTSNAKIYMDLIVCFKL